MKGLLWCGMLAWCAAAALAAGGRSPAGKANKTPQRPVATANPQGLDFFEARVRPLLAARCFACHGPAQHQGGLRLDSPAAILKGGGRGPALVPGHPEQSLLLQVVHYDGALKMPPTGKLQPGEIAALAEWVRMGAPWPQAGQAASPSTGGFSISEPQRKHWAFQPVRQPPLPPVKNRAWVRTPIDQFILSKLEQKGLTPSKPADRRTLIRRATFDLTGLPPTADQIDSFERDSSPNAFAKVVDRLLESPRYGERWGRFWLDVARYADTKGYVFEEERRYPFAYTYRDYVIRAFNEDLPYDRFLIQQIAADQLPLGDDRRPLAAMGFLTLGRRFLNNQPDIIDDRIDVVTRGTMALTVQCARCHDHKFDPIPTKDYYSLYGVFASSIEPKELPLIGVPERTAAYLTYEKELKEREVEVARFVETRRKELQPTFRSRVADYLLAEREARAQASADRIFGFARSRDLNPLLLQRWHAYLDETRKAHHPVFAPWHAFAELPEKDFAARAPALAAQIVANRDPQKRINPLVAKVLAGGPPATLRDVAQRYEELLAGADAAWQKMQAQLAVESRQSAVESRQSAVEPGQAAAGNSSTHRPIPTALPDPAQEALRQVLYGPGSPPDIPAAEVERAFNRADRDRLRALQRRVDQLKATSPGAPAHAMALQDAAAPVTPHVFVRGNPANQGDEVPRQFLLVVAGEKRQPFKNGSGRLELAQAIASRSNPLTARVLVNRVWLHHFGAPLVRTPGDFGMRSESPTHPELLDWLAGYFVGNEEIGKLGNEWTRPIPISSFPDFPVTSRGCGWRLKALHRLIMLSSAYQQSSDDDPRCSRADPENRFLWHMSRQRLDLEAMRDSLLAVSGQLDPTAGGPPVELTSQPFSRRRTVYGFIDRQNLQGLFRTFDFATPDATSPQRYSTTVPQQALFLMNSPFVVEQARHLAGRPEVSEKTEPAQRIQALYRLVYGRAAATDEVRMGLEFLRTAEAARSGQAIAAQPPETPKPLTPWEEFAQVLLMSNEFHFVD
jgi:mono/diheme cytochrome c family protein